MYESRYPELFPEQGTATHILYHLLAYADGGRLTKVVLQLVSQTVFPENGTGAVHGLKQGVASEHVEVEGIRM